MLYKILTYIIALVWLINGIFCKVLNLVPRHELIVERILNTPYSRELTVVIGLAETLMAIWILSRYKSSLNAIVQVVVIAIMNTLEFLIAPDLLLWGKLNAVFAFVFIVVILYNEFYLNRNPG